MSRSRNTQLVSVTGAMLLATAAAAAQCQMIDFEDQPVGTVITNQYPGVLFLAAPQTCEPDYTVYMRIADEHLGHSFSNRALLIDGGCPDFSDDYPVMVFDRAHDDVSFTLGPWGSGSGITYEIRVYDVVSGGTPITTQTVGIPGTGVVNWKVFSR